MLGSTKALLFLLQKVPVQAGDEVEIFADGLRSVASDGPNQVRPKQAKCSGDNHHHIALRPGLSSDEEGSQVLDYLNDFYAFSGQTDPREVPAANFRSIQNTNDAAHAHDVFGIGQHWDHPARLIT